MGHCQQHQVLGREDPEAAAEAFPLRELLQPVRPAGVGGKDRRHRMPGMALEKARRAVVAGDDEDIDGWIDQIETTMTDVSFIKAATSDLVKVYAWTYSGSVQEWDESILEISFSIETMCSRFDPQAQNDPP